MKDHVQEARLSGEPDTTDKGDVFQMKPVILYYSLGGATRAEAKKRAESSGADVFEVLEAKKRGIFSAFIPGCPQALNRKSSAIQPLSIDWTNYDDVTLMAPVWAGHPAPAFNSALELVPKDKVLHIVLCSGGGETPKSKDATINLLRQRGYALSSYEDVKTAPPTK